MSSKAKTKKTDGIKHYEGVDIAGLPEGTDADVADMLDATKSKIRITTMLDTDILEELKRRAAQDGDGRYQTYLNHLLRQVLFDSGVLDEGRVVEIVKGLVKPGSLRKLQGQ